jgi:hypothetical protein
MEIKIVLKSFAEFPILVSVPIQELLHFLDFFLESRTLTGRFRSAVVFDELETISDDEFMEKLAAFN